MKNLSAISFQLSALGSRLTACGLRLEACGLRVATGEPCPAAAGSLIPILSLLFAVSAVFLAGTAWAADPGAAGSAATEQVTNVACGVIGLVQGVVGKMLAFVFLAAGAIAAFVGKWGYVAGGVGGGILLIIGPQILEKAFIGTGTCP